MNLYRAIYQRPQSKGGTLRKMTFASKDDAGAELFAAKYGEPDDRLLNVKLLRPLTEQLRLEGT